MNETRNRVRSIFLNAVENYPPERWEAYLDEVCGDDPDLRGRVKVLLEADQRADSLLDRPEPNDQTAPDATVNPPGPSAEGPGMAIGPYKLLEPLGEGGMGVVYRAEQTNPVRRQVALKIIKPGMDTRQVIARFEAERQALALMDHPGIAKVLDAGATDTGRPYFVMELVKGVPITTYCDTVHLTTRERLELFIAICQAIQHAHQKGIVHRDIKPSNVMITMVDGKPVPKVIDFGVAKAIDQRLTERTMFTQHGAIVGTFEYMSPEQAELSGLDIDTRSDVYALGVLLYELLTGSTPLKKERVRQAAYSEILRQIREVEPPKPSTRLSDSGDRLASLAAQRRTEPARLAKQVRGELDWIVMKALDKNRTRRYETANGFARDIQRHLDGDPVEAGPPSASYKLRKFARKHRAALVIIIAFAAVLLIAATVGTYLAIRATNAERLTSRHLADVERANTATTQALADTNRAKVDTEAALALAKDRLSLAQQTVDDVYVEVASGWMDQMPRMDEAQTRFLEKALSFYEKFAEQEEKDITGRLQRGRNYMRIGEILSKLEGRGREGAKAFDRAVSTLEPLATQAPDRAEVRERLAEAYSFAARSKDRAAGEALRRRAVSVAEKLAADFPKRSECRMALAKALLELHRTILHDTARVEEAEKVWLQFVNVLGTTRPNEQDDAASSLLALGYGNRGSQLLDHGQARQKEAEQSFREAQRIYDALESHPKASHKLRNLMAHNLGNMAIVLIETGRHDEAEKVLHRAVALRERNVAEFPRPGYRGGLALTLNSLGAVLAQLGRGEEAERAWRRGLEIETGLAGEFPTVPSSSATPLMAAFHGNLGLTKAGAGSYQAALAHYRSALELFRVLHAAQPTNTIHRDGLANIQENLAAILADCPDTRLREPAEALVLAKQAVADARQPVREHWITMGIAHYRTGNWDAAIKALMRANELEGDEGNRVTFAVHGFFLAMAHSQQGDREQARIWYERSVKWAADHLADKNLLRHRAEAEALLFHPAFPVDPFAPPAP